MGNVGVGMVVIKKEWMIDQIINIPTLPRTGMIMISLVFRHRKGTHAAFSESAIKDKGIRGVMVNRSGSRVGTTNQTYTNQGN